SPASSPGEGRAMCKARLRSPGRVPRRYPGCPRRISLRQSGRRPTGGKQSGNAEATLQRGSLWKCSKPSSLHGKYAVQKARAFFIPVFRSEPEPDFCGRSRKAPALRAALIEEGLVKMNTLVIVLSAAVCLSAAYALYGRWIARSRGIDPTAKTPAVAKNDGKDYVPTNGWVVFSLQFSSIAGAGPVTGAIQAAAFGW